MDVQYIWFPAKILIFRKNGINKLVFEDNIIVNSYIQDKQFEYRFNINAVIYYVENNNESSFHIIIKEGVNFYLFSENKVEKVIGFNSSNVYGIVYMRQDELYDY
jgi:hypothetical protein